MRVTLAVLATSVTSCAPPTSLFSQGLNPITKATLDGVAPSAESCGSCHTEAYETWSASRHAASFRNPNFRQSVSESHVKEWCLNCHQPLRLLQNEHGRPAEEGVSCVVCHIRDNALVVSKPLSARGREKHPETTVIPNVNQSEFCAGCHQFSGPTSTHPITYTGDPVQNTYNEWAQSNHSSHSCQDCHMPQGQHSFHGAHHKETVNKALSIQQTPQGLAIKTTPAVAHAVPTGDPFRRIVLRICGVSCDTVLVRRTFGIQHTYIDGIMRVTKDTRLQSPGHSGDTVVVPLPTGARKWELEYFFADPRLHQKLPREEVSVLLQSGQLNDPSARTDH